jgi:hypothetical protein
MTITLFGVIYRRFRNTNLENYSHVDITRSETKKRILQSVYEVTVNGSDFFKTVSGALRLFSIMFLVKCNFKSQEQQRDVTSSLPAAQPFDLSKFKVPMGMADGRVDDYSDDGIKRRHITAKQ